MNFTSTCHLLRVAKHRQPMPDLALLLPLVHPSLLSQGDPGCKPPPSAAHVNALHSREQVDVAGDAHPGTTKPQVCDLGFHIVAGAGFEPATFGL
jgi:hypothetical protein